MATIYNSELSRELIDGGKIQTSRDNIPTQIADKVVPVMEVNPKLLRRCTIVRRSTAISALTSTIYTTPANGDFYISALEIAYSADAAATTTNFTITATIDGASRIIAELRRVTGAADKDSLYLGFPIPIKIDRNTIIAINSATADVSFLGAGIIYGYLSESSKA